MKTRTTKKAIMSAYRNIIKVGYCDLQDALMLCGLERYVKAMVVLGLVGLAAAVAFVAM